MSAIQRIGDPNTGGGPIISTQGTVYANDKAVGIVGSTVGGHGRKGHALTSVASGSPNVFIGGIPVTRTGDVDVCGHNRASGSPNVFVN